MGEWSSGSLPQWGWRASSMKTLIGLPARARRTGVAVIAATLGLGAVTALAGDPPPAHFNGTVGLDVVGPIDASPSGGGFPIYYKDTNGLRLELCLDQNDPFCIAGNRPDPQAAVTFPDNFPDEAFWFAAGSTIALAGGSADLGLDVEAAFASADGLPAAGQQIAFSRIRTRVQGIPEGHYTVTHPYGVDVYDVT